MLTDFSNETSVLSTILYKSFVSEEKFQDTSGNLLTCSDVRVRVGIKQKSNYDFCSEL